MQFKIFFLLNMKFYNNSGQIHTFKKTPPHKGQMVKQKKTNETMFLINYLFKLFILQKYKCFYMPRIQKTKN